MFRKIAVVAILISIAVGLQACAEKLSPQESCNFVQNGSLQRVSWGPQTPVLLYIDNSVPNAYFDAIRSAIKVWNQAVGREVLKVAGWADIGDEPSQDGINVIYFMNYWEPNLSNEQARTTVYWAGDRIYEADIRVNARDFEFFWGDEPIPNRVDIESLMIHELGHVLGLAHPDGHEAGVSSSGGTGDSRLSTVMARSLPNATLRRQVSEFDLNSVRCEY